MNVLFTRFPLESRLGGAEVQTIALMKGLRERGHQVRFVGNCPTLLRLCQQEQIPARLLELGPPPVTPWLSLSFLWRKQKMTTQLHSIAEAKPDVVLMLSLSEKLLLTKTLSDQGSKVFWIEHDRVGDWLRKNPWLGLLRRLSQLATTICVSDLSQKMYHNLGWSADRTMAIPNGIDEKRFPEAPSLKNGKHVGCVARLSEDKGVDLLIEAVAAIPDVQLSIVGAGTESEALRTLIAERFLGERVKIRETAELNSFYHSIDVLVLPSREHDPFGLVAAEAMLCGVAVIVTDACGIAGYLESGKDALIVPANDESTLREAIQKICTDENLRRTLGERGRQTAHAKFRLDQMIDRYESLLTR